MFMSYDGTHLPPGEAPPFEIVFEEATTVLWGRLDQAIINGIAPISGAARDAGNTPTDVIRSGLLLTKDANGKYVEWGSVDDMDTDKIEGVLLTTIKMQRMGTDSDRHMGYVLVGGCVKAGGLIVPGATDAGISGHAKAAIIRAQMWPAFRFDDDPVGHTAVLPAE